MRSISFDIENSYAESSGDAVLGCDEAGRGCLAGPVVAACAWIGRDKFPRGLLARIDDSKKISENAREKIFEELAALPPDAFLFAAAEVDAATIDRINILQASLLAMKNAYEKLLPRLPRPPIAVLVDGNRAPEIANAKTVVGGDARSYSIAAASIVAKVAKDRALGKIALEYPQYGFAKNKGYPTASHLAALAEHGPCPAHRMTYAPVSARVKK
ncbi:MAG: ribonuclease HII [Rickettsiales bacterium]|jgi:ribonuclease HII|nr:ribonuclease HII [Rickettsiales bacterium]